MESLQLQEFFVEGGKQQKSHVLLHITEPSNAGEEKKGNFFAIAELNNAATATILNLQKIIEEVESRYYASEESAGEHNLETALKTINLEHQDAAKESNDLHCVIGVIRQKEIIFSYHGTPQILMFYKNKEGTYKKIDLINPTEENTNDKLQLFSQIIQGKISSGDYILATTPNVAKYFNQDRLQKITTTRPPRQIAEHLERVLSELRNDLSFGGLIIHLNAGATTKDRLVASPNPNNHQKNGSEKSLKQLFSREKQTADTLSPGLMTQLNGKINNLFKTNAPEDEQSTRLDIVTPTEIYSTHLRPRESINDKPKTDWERTILNTLKQTGKGLRAIALTVSWLGLMIFRFFVNLSKTLLALFFIATNLQNRRRNILDNWRRDWQNRRLYFEQLPITTKLLLLGAATTALIFLGSVWYLRVQQQTNLQNQKFEEQLTAIIVKRDNAESALVYNDTPTALAELTTAKTELKTIECWRDRSKTQRCEAIAHSIDQLLGQLKKSYSAQLEILTTWTDASLNNILKIGNLLIAYSSTSPSLYSYDLLTKQTDIINTMFTGYVSAAVPKENDFAVLLYGENELAEFSPETKTVKKIEISFPENQAGIQSITVYNRRLYSLDSVNQQIYKHDRTKTGFGIGQNWIKSDNNYLLDANDITIDGDIFLTHKNGTASKWTGGKRNEFNLNSLYPPLSPASSLWTYNDLQYLYILDSIGKRLIIVDKNGGLINQTEINELSNPRGLVVEEKNKRAFIADSGKLYQISLP